MLRKKRPEASLANPLRLPISFYIDEPSVNDNNLITASTTGALLWTKQIIGRLGVFEPNTLESWFDYFNTGDAKYFFALMQTLPSGN